MGWDRNEARWPGWILLLPLALAAIAMAKPIAGWLPGCFFYRETGLLCPGCGATRSAVALSRGDLGEALQTNILLVGGLFLGGSWLLLAAMRERFPAQPMLRPFHYRLSFLWVTLAVVAAFWLLRNLPGFEALRPR